MEIALLWVRISTKGGTKKKRTCLVAVILSWLFPKKMTSRVDSCFACFLFFFFISPPSWLSGIRWLTRSPRCVCCGSCIQSVSKAAMLCMQAAPLAALSSLVTSLKHQQELTPKQTVSLWSFLPFRHRVNRCSAVEISLQGIVFAFGRQRYRFRRRSTFSSAGESWFKHTCAKQRGSPEGQAQGGEKGTVPLYNTHNNHTWLTPLPALPPAPASPATVFHPLPTLTKLSRKLERSLFARGCDQRVNHANQVFFFFG